MRQWGRKEIRKSSGIWNFLLNDQYHLWKLDAKNLQVCLLVASGAFGEHQGRLPGVTFPRLSLKSGRISHPQTRLLGTRTILRNSTCRRNSEGRATVTPWQKGNSYLWKKSPFVEASPSPCQEEDGNSKSWQSYQRRRCRQKSVTRPLVDHAFLGYVPLSSLPHTSLLSFAEDSRSEFWAASLSYSLFLSISQVYMSYTC